ncbi:MAG: hypothetical protein IPN36_15280 [Bacteroidetes bacterium]|nr:hypothetical protein [Bacteroidota bacterium]
MHPEIKIASAITANGLTDDNVPALPNPVRVGGTAAACLPGIAGSTSYIIAPVAGATSYPYGRYLRDL